MNATHGPLKNQIVVLLSWKMASFELDSKSLTRAVARGWESLFAFVARFEMAFLLISKVKQSSWCSVIRLQTINKSFSYYFRLSWLLLYEIRWKRYFHFINGPKLLATKILVMYLPARWRCHIKTENLTSVVIYFFIIYLLLLMISILAIFPRKYLGTKTLMEMVLTRLHIGTVLAVQPPESKFICNEWPTSWLLTSLRWNIEMEANLLIKAVQLANRFFLANNLFGVWGRVWCYQILLALCGEQAKNAAVGLA